MFIKPQWPAPSYIKAYTTLRQGGRSKPPYNDFNLGDHVDDDPQDVADNRKLLKQTLSLTDEPVWIRQTHSTIVIEATEQNRGQEADASFSTQTKQACAVLTADCLPLLCCSTKQPYVAAIHAGWRGLANGIIENTLKDIPPDELLVWLGPAIGPEQFEVGEDVVDAFISHMPEHQKAFKPCSPDKWLANIYELARDRLKAMGISQIYGGDYCTFTQSDHFFSHRRDKGKTGRMASLIWME